MVTKLGRIASWTLATLEPVPLVGPVHKYREVVLEIHAPLGALVTVEDRNGALILGEVVGYQEFSVMVTGEAQMTIESEHEAYWRSDDSKPTAVDGARLKTYRKPYVERVRDPVMERYMRHTQRTMENMAQQQADALAAIQKDVAAERKRTAAELKRLEDVGKATKPVESNPPAQPAPVSPVGPTGGA